MFVFGEQEDIPKSVSCLLVLTGPAAIFWVIWLRIRALRKSTGSPRRLEVVLSRQEVGILGCEKAHRK